MKINNKLIKTEDKPIARAYQSSEITNVPHNIWINNILDIVDYDNANGFDITNNRYIVPKSGYYRVHSSIWFLNVVANKVYQLKIVKNGYVEIASAWAHSALNDSLIFNASTTQYFSQGDYISMAARHKAGVDTVSIGQTRQYTFLEIEYLRN